MKASEIRALLVDQHTQLRRLMDDLRGVPERLSPGEKLDLALEDGLERLGNALADHNEREEELIRGVLSGAEAGVGIFLDEEHRREHASLRDALEALRSAATPRRVSHLVTFLDRLLDHMAKEERDFLDFLGEPLVAHWHDIA